MKKLSLRTMFWIIFGIACGYFLGWAIGMLLGTIIWTLMAVVFGGLINHSTNSIFVNTILSIAFGILLALLIGSFDKRFFGSKMSLTIWVGIGAALGAIVMFSYGINFITHPEDYVHYQRLFPGWARMTSERRSELLPSFDFMIHTAFGLGTGRFIGVYLGLFAGLLISIRENIGRSRTAEEKKEFDEYSNFFKEHLKK